MFRRACDPSISERWPQDLRAYIALNCSGDSSDMPACKTSVHPVFEHAPRRWSDACSFYLNLSHARYFPKLDFTFFWISERVFEAAALVQQTNQKDTWRSNRTFAVPTYGSNAVVFLPASARLQLLPTRSLKKGDKSSMELASQASSTTWGPFLPKNLTGHWDISAFEKSIFSSCLGKVSEQHFKNKFNVLNIIPIVERNDLLVLSVHFVDQTLLLSTWNRNMLHSLQMLSAPS